MSPYRYVPPVLRTGVLLLGLLALALPAAAKGAPHARHARAHARHAAAPSPTLAAAGMHGLVVGIDPETGRLGLPTPEQRLELTQAEKTGLLRTAAGLEPVRLADGSVKLDLQGRFMEYSVLRLDAAGRPVIGCLDGAEALSRWLRQPPVAPALEVK